VKQTSEFGPRYAGVNELPGRTRANFPEIVDPLFWQVYGNASRFSLLHVTGFYNLFQSLNYISRNRLPGDIVECGCFLGGAGIFMALLRDHLGISDKTIYLFDSFEGFPKGEEDAMLGKPVKSSRYADTEADVRDNIAQAAPDCGRIELIRGFVEQTLPDFRSGMLCLLRLDTDFYNSTKIEFETLYDRLVPGGVLIVDDYGMFAGSRKATDEFFAARENLPLLNRIDRGVWAGVKPG